MSSIVDIAKAAGVSNMTVSRVINGKGNVKEETRQKVLRALEKFNYIPNNLARGLVRNKTNMWGLIVPDITNPFFTTIVRGVEDVARKNGNRIVLGNTDENLIREREYVEICVSIRADGVVIAPAGDESIENLQLLRKYEIPFVLVDRTVSGIEADCVCGDSVAGAQKLVSHLIKMGHRHIGMLNGYRRTSTARDRRLGYQQALQAANLPFRAELVRETAYNREDGTSSAEAELDALLELDPNLTAIFAANNFAAVRTIRHLRSRGYSVPGDFSVVCFDDVDPLSLAVPFLSVAMQPAYKFGAVGAQMLHQRITGQMSEQVEKILLQPEIVIRDSAQAVSLD